MDQTSQTFDDVHHSQHNEVIGEEVQEVFYRPAVERARVGELVKVAVAREGNKKKSYLF